MSENDTEIAASLIELAGEITIAWLQNPNVNPGAQDVPAFLKDMHAAVTELSSDKSSQPEIVTYEPAVSPRGSVKSDHLVSLIDGKKYKTLKRHLALHDLTPAQYRERYGLKADYPMVAPDYAAQRREIAQKLGLGRKRTVPAAAAASAPGEAVSAPTKAPAKAKAVAAKPAVAAKKVSAKTAKAVTAGAAPVAAVVDAKAVAEPAVKSAPKAAPKPKSAAKVASKVKASAEPTSTVKAKAPAKPKAKVTPKAEAKPKAEPKTTTAKTPAVEAVSEAPAKV
jgi:predicted transcriptional regulator